MAGRLRWAFSSDEIPAVMSEAADYAEDVARRAAELGPDAPMPVVLSVTTEVLSVHNFLAAIGRNDELVDFAMHELPKEMKRLRSAFIAMNTAVSPFVRRNAECRRTSSLRERPRVH
jgi:hypothetical protein